RHLIVLLSLHLTHFFLQEEDGIRDFHVTGVQTCALPILKEPWSMATMTARPSSLKMRRMRRITPACDIGATPPLRARPSAPPPRSEEHTSELQSRENLVCRLLLEKKNSNTLHNYPHHEPT